MKSELDSADQIVQIRNKALSESSAGWPALKFLIAAWSISCLTPRKLANLLRLIAFLCLTQNWTALCKPGLFLDQSFGPPFVSEGPFALFYLQDLAQTFTVGRSGLLARVDVLLDGPFDPGDLLEFDIRPTFNGLPLASDSTGLINRTLSVSYASYDWIEIDFSDSPIPIWPGEVLAIVLRSPVNGGFTWYGDDFGDYEGGLGVARDPTVTDTWGGPGLYPGDLAFRTYVIPESSSIVSCLSSIGLAALISWKRRRKNQRTGIFPEAKCKFRTRIRIAV